MITELHLENFLFLRETHLRFGPGLNVITGETGAGKSILLEAVKLLLGKKGRAGLVLEGGNVAKVQASFDLAEVPAARRFLEDAGFLDEDAPSTLLLARTFRKEGTEKIHLNGLLATAGVLRDLGRHLMEIHGQNEHQSLLLPDVQRRLLDRTGGEKHQARLTDLQEATRQRSELEGQLADLEERLAKGAQRQEELQVFLQDVEELSPTGPQEDRDLHEHLDRLTHGETIAAALGECAMALDGDDQTAGATPLLYRAREALRPALAHDPQLAQVMEHLESLYQETREAGLTVGRARESIEYDPERIASLQSRLSQIAKVCRRYRVDLPALIELTIRSRSEIQELTAPDTRRRELQGQLAEVCRRQSDLAAAVSEGRRKLAQALQKSVVKEMAGLGFAAAVFQVVLRPVEIGAMGAETVEFNVALNPGVPGGPLRKIASGGELSRVALALKNVLARSDELPTLLFDEIDAGIGGHTAEAVAASLRSLGRQKQVILVTHLHQIAKEGQTHFTVCKAVKAGKTQVAIDEVTGEGRTAEIARMLGRSGEEGLTFARALLRRKTAARASSEED